jgi:hypothetical protein
MSIISHFKNSVTQRFLPLFGVPVPNFAGGQKGDIAHIGDRFRVDADRNVFIGGQRADAATSDRALNNLRKGLAVGVGIGALAGLFLSQVPFVTFAASAVAAGAVMFKMLGPSDETCAKIADQCGFKDSGAWYVRGAMAVGAAAAAWVAAPVVFPIVAGVAGGSFGLGLAAQENAKSIA